jgi:hypothetical protein
MGLTRSAAVALGAAFLALALVVPAASAKSTVPFSASFNETFTVFVGGTCAPNAFCASATGLGQATHMGKTTEAFVGSVVLPLDQNGCAPESSTGTLTAANGDQVFVTSAGTFCQSSLTNATDVGSWTVTGGTGRFTGATGSGPYTTTILINSDGSGGTSTSTYSGTISTPGS